MPAITTLLEWFQKLLMIFWVPFWNASNQYFDATISGFLMIFLSPVLKTLLAICYFNATIWAISHDFFEFSSENFACHQYFDATIWQSSHDFFESSSENFACHQYFDAKIWEVSHDLCNPVLTISSLLQRFEKFLMIFWVQFWKFCLPSVLRCKDLRSFSWLM
jgi:hypothetical protein